MKHFFDITGFQLKIAAIVAMTCNHVANVFGPTVLGAPLCFVLYMVGGVTFPIMAFLLVEGYVHTSNLRKYALRLLAFAAVAQVPYYLVFGPRLNVLFTLLIGLGILWVRGRYNSGFGLLVTCVCTALLHDVMDWGTTGLVIIYMFGTLREAQRAPHVSRETCDVNITLQVVENVSRETFSNSESPLSGVDAGNVKPALHWDQGSVSEYDVDENVSRETIDMGYAGSNVNSALHSDENPNIENVSRETIDAEHAAKMARRRDLVTIIGTMIVPMVVTCFNGLRLGSGYALAYALVGYTLATMLLCSYHGRRGRSMKWFFYAYYPIHLFAIWLITLAL